MADLIQISIDVETARKLIDVIEDADEHSHCPQAVHVFAANLRNAVNEHSDNYRYKFGEDDRREAEAALLRMVDSDDSELDKLVSDYFDGGGSMFALAMTARETSDPKIKGLLSRLHESLMRG